MRFLYLLQAESAMPPPPSRLMEELDKMARRERAAGRMIFDGGLAPIQTAAKWELSGRQLRMLDGPFSETKEVIVGFAIFEFSTREEALKSAHDFLEIHREYGNGTRLKCEMREIFTHG